MKGLIQTILKPFGLTLSRIRPQTGSHSAAFGLDNLFSLLSRKGFAARHVIDVGANHGHWTRKAIEYFPSTHYTLVEPQDHLKIYVQDLITDGRAQWICAGVSDQPGHMPFTACHRDDSSTFTPDPSRQQGTEPQPIIIEVKTLDQIVAESGLLTPEMVKVDAEGFDLRALIGAKSLFGKTDIFLVEAAVCCPHFQNSVAEVVRFMTHGGYKLIDITDLNRSPKDNALWLSELAFARTDSPLLETMTSYQ